MRRPRLGKSVSWDIRKGPYLSYVQPENMDSSAIEAAFTRDLKDRHLVYDYNAQDEQGNTDKWRYEIWFFSQVRDFIFMSLVH